MCFLVSIHVFSLRCSSPRLTIVTIAYGDAMRAWIDIGYSYADNN